MEGLLKDLEGLGLKVLEDDENAEGAGVKVPCEMCDENKQGEPWPNNLCNFDCGAATLRYIAKKLTELKYTKVPDVVPCSRCGELPRFYLIKYSAGNIGWACNCELCEYGSLSGGRNIKAAINRWNEWNDQEQQDAWAGSRAEIHEKELREKQNYVKVVRCGDCAEWHEHEWSSEKDPNDEGVLIENRFCSWKDGRVEADGFCNHGTPKEAE